MAQVAHKPRVNTNGHLPSVPAASQNSSGATPHRANRPRGVLNITIAAVVLLTVSLLSLGFGTIRLSPTTVIAALTDSDHSDVSTIIWSIRFPRIVVSILVGGALAGVGVLMQAVFRNPLADPGITGVSAGAAVGAVTGITLGMSGGLQWGVPFAAFAGSLLVALMLQVVLRSPRSAGNYTIILVGVAVNAFAGALISILIANARDDALARGAVFWLAGDLELRTWGHAAIAVGPIVVGLALLWSRAYALDALLLGDDVASTSGFDAHRTKLGLLLVASLVTGAAVAVSGIISFVGLVVPHAVRLVTGAKHSRLLPLSVIYGATFLVIADTLARVATAKVVIQTGAVSALVGAPVFLALVMSRRSA